MRLLLYSRLLYSQLGARCKMLHPIHLQRIYEMKFKNDIGTPLVFGNNRSTNFPVSKSEQSDSIFRSRFFSLKRSGIYVYVQ